MRAHFSVLVEVELERLHVLLEAQRAHGPQEVVPVDGFPFLPLALVAGPVAPTSASAIGGGGGCGGAVAPKRLPPPILQGEQTRGFNEGVRDNSCNSWSFR